MTWPVPGSRQRQPLGKKTGPWWPWPFELGLPSESCNPLLLPWPQVWCLSVDEEMGLEQIGETFLEVARELWVYVLCSPLSSSVGFMSKVHLEGAGGEHTVSECHRGKCSGPQCKPVFMYCLSGNLSQQEHPPWGYLVMSIIENLQSSYAPFLALVWY